MISLNALQSGTLQYNVSAATPAAASGAAVLAGMAWHVPKTLCETSAAQQQFIDKTELHL